MTLAHYIFASNTGNEIVAVKNIVTDRGANVWHFEIIDVRN